MDSSVGAAHAAWLITRLRLQRLWNLLRSTYRFRKKTAARTATPQGRMSALGVMLTAFVLFSMVFGCVSNSIKLMSNMQTALGRAEIHRDVEHGRLGAQLIPLTAGQADGLGIAPTHGALVAGLSDQGPAWRAGLKIGDVIVGFGGKTVTGPAELRRLIATAPPAEDVEIEFLRNGSLLRTTTVLAVQPDDAKPGWQAIPPAPGSALAPNVLRGAAFEATLLLLAALSFALAGREIAKPEWDLEWLATLPLPLPTLIASRFVERTLTNLGGFILLAPFLSVVAWKCGYRWTAPLLGVALGVILLVLVATFQTLVDTGLRLSLSPPKLRSVQAIVSVVGVFPLMLALSGAFHDNAFVFGWIAAMPDAIAWLPPGLAVHALAAADDGVGTALWLTALVVEAAAIVAIAFVVLQRQLRHGVIGAGAREAARRGSRIAPRKDLVPASAPLRIAPIQRRELILLSRDRTYMTQTLLLPIVIVGMQVVLYATSNIFVGAMDQPANLAAIAFAMATFALMGSAFQTLNAEGQALWILYTLPYSLESVLRQKAKLWAGVATLYPIVIFAIAAGMAGRVSLPFVGDAAIVVLGVPIYAAIASALGVFACNPLSQEVQRRVRVTFVYLYMLLVSLYVYAIYADNVFQKLATIVLAALLAIALWQKARDRLDYLLEPTQAPPARVSAADGLIAAMMFFVAQGVIVISLRLADSGLAIGTTIWIGFCGGGALTYTVMRLTYRWTKTSGVPCFFGPDLPRAALWGVAGGGVAALFGLAYIAIMSAMQLLPRHTAGSGTALWLLALAVLAAPVFEEFIFRGLIFGGLRRSLGLASATFASAAIFAIVHPPLSMLPVFLLGVCTAFVYERTKMLAAPMLAHALYNAVVLGFQWNLMQ